jgi:hypothetical protein
MQIDKQYKLEKAVSKDQSRENMQNIWTTKHHAFATNGTILAAVPVTNEKDDTTGWLTPECLKLARRGVNGSDAIAISLNGQMTIPGGMTLPRPTESRFPHIFRLLRHALSNRKVRFALNAGHLRNLSEAIGSEEVIIELGNTDEAIVIRPLHESNSALGLVMPIRITE